jgi:hypothetical protein
MFCTLKALEAEQLIQPVFFDDAICCCCVASFLVHHGQNKLNSRSLFVTHNRFDNASDALTCIPDGIRLFLRLSRLCVCFTVVVCLPNSLPADGGDVGRGIV